MTRNWQPILRLGPAISAGMIVVILVAAVIQSAAARPLDQATPPGETTSSTIVNYLNCRFGVGGAISTYAVSALNFGWYMDWGLQLQPARPSGAEYVQMVRLTGNVPSTGTVQAIVDQNPGTLWLIGNEPDSPWQDSLLPETYARAYHDWYQLIKQRDPSARIGVGSIVQPTALRLRYLDRVLTAYQANYEARLPADVWSTHSYILREIDPSDPDALNGTQSVWGAYIPPGFAETRGELYTFSQMFDQNIFRQRLIDFRAWLAARGYRNTPLYITEFGTLFPYPPYTIDAGGLYTWTDELNQPIIETRTSAFMTTAFNTLLSLTDTNIGYPADSNRLVQRWIWYSFDDKAYGGLLFDPITGGRRPLGDDFAAYTQAISPGVDLLAVNFATPAVPIGAGNTASATLRATVSNIGNISISQPVTVSFYAGLPPVGTLIASTVVTPPLAGCAATTDVTVLWPNVSVGIHPFYAELDPTNIVAETNESNNRITGSLFVATHQWHFPLIAR